MRVNRYWGNKLIKALCLLAGVGAAAYMVHKLAPPLRWDLPPAEVPVAFVKKGASEDGPGAPAPTEEASPAVAPMPVSFPVEASAPVPQTPLPVPEKKAIPPAQKLAPLSPQETAPVTPTIGQYPETRGGNVLVFQVTINEHNLVVDSELKVPSYDALYDISMVTGAFGQKVQNVYPPMTKGELRKVDVRLTLPPEFSQEQALIERTRLREQGLDPDKVEKFVPPEQLLP